MDVLVYRCGFGCKDLGWRETANVMDHNVKQIISKFPTEYVGVISGSGPTFRHQIAKTVPYKGQRKAEKPKYYNELREYLKERWAAFETDNGLEADDFIGIHTTRQDYISTIDKDLLMIPAKGHYNFVKDEVRHIHRNLYFLFHQALTGDKADNIVGLTGVGEATATEWLEGVKIKDMKNIVYSRYVEEFGDKAAERFDENLNLLWILRDLNKRYVDYI